MLPKISLIPFRFHHGIISFPRVPWEKLCCTPERWRPLTCLSKHIILKSPSGASAAEARGAQQHQPGFHHPNSFPPHQMNLRWRLRAAALHAHLRVCCSLRDVYVEFRVKMCRHVRHLHWSSTTESSCIHEMFPLVIGEVTHCVCVCVCLCERSSSAVVLSRCLLKQNILNVSVPWFWFWLKWMCFFCTKINKSIKKYTFWMMDYFINL